MTEERQIILAPAKINHRSDQPYYSSPQPFKSKALLHQEEKTSKCIVYILATIVALSAILLIFSLIALRADSPDLGIDTIRVTNLVLGNATSPSFNVTLVAQLTIQNHNFGYFNFDNGSSSGSISYSNINNGTTKVTTGLMNIGGGRVRARETKMMNVTVGLMRSNGVNDTSLSSDLNSGVLKLNSFVKLHGKVNLFDIRKKIVNPEVSCSMNLVLSSRVIQNLLCI